MATYVTVGAAVIIAISGLASVDANTKGGITEKKHLREKRVLSSEDNNYPTYAPTSPYPTYIHQTYYPTSHYPTYPPTSPYPTNHPTYSITSPYPTNSHPTYSPTLSYSTHFHPTYSPTLHYPTYSPHQSKDSNANARSSSSTETYNVYFGYLHAHTGVSDGVGTPEMAYSQAKAAGLDFFGTSDHDYYPEYMTDKNWQYINRVADSYNEDGVYTALVGFEWTSDSKGWGIRGHNFGHMTVVGTPTWCNAEQSSCDTLDEFVNWLDSQPTGLAIMNHPGQYSSTLFNNFHYKYTPRIIGMELWNRDDDYYTKKGKDGIRYYDEALQKGWHIGAGGGQDNHFRNWGKESNSRMAVLATDLSREGIMEALQARRFYSTLIDGVILSFQCDGHDMGSVIRFADKGSDKEHSCTVDVMSSHSFTWIEFIQNGDDVVSVQNPTFPFTAKIRASSGGYEYVYAVLWQGNDWKVVTSPIFFGAKSEEEYH